MRAAREYPASVTIRNYVGLLLAWSLMASVGHGDRNADSPPAVQFDQPILMESVFRIRAQQRLLAAARTDIREGRLAAAFQQLRELLRQPYDSSLPVPPEGPVGGIRSTVLKIIAELPPSARRSWSRFCDGQARAALQKALNARSRTALMRVAAEYPYSSAAAEALITETIWAMNAHETQSARAVLQQLQEWIPAGVLSSSQTLTVQKLEVALHRGDPSDDESPTDSVGLNAARRLQPASTWTWQESLWNHGEWPDSLPRHASGDRFDHSSFWQLPLVTSDYVLMRTPAGVACLNRDTGTELWFLPLKSGTRGHSGNQPGEESLLDVTPAPDHRLELAGDILYFVDGKPVAPVRSKDPFQRSIVLEQGATHLTAVRAGPSPSVLWQISGFDSSTVTDPASAETDAPLADYQFRFPADSPASQSGVARAAPSAPHSDRLQGHLFLSAPRVHAGRLYVTTHFDGVIWLNCLSATNGGLIWQQPLTWNYSGHHSVSHDAAVVGAISGDTVVCLSAGGLIAGCSTVDGRIHWLQSVRPDDADEPEPDDFRFAFQADSRMIPQTGAGSSLGALWLVRSPTGVVCGRRGSPVLCSLDPSTGERQWSVSRSVQGTTASQQPDMACIGQTATQLIMMGYGHCRAIDSATGVQTWIQPLGAHSGRVCCYDSTIYAALNGGQLLTIDAATGSIRQTQPLQLGQTGPALVVNRTGVIEASSWRVRSWHWQDRTPESGSAELTQILTRLVAHRLHQLGDPVTDFTAVPQLTADECIERASTADLNPNQQLVFALCTPDLASHTRLLSDAYESHPNQPVELLPGWSMPLSGAIRTLNLTTMFPGVASPADDILYPERLGSFDEQLRTAQRLLDEGRRPEAELLLLNMLLKPESAEDQTRHEHLREVRDGALASGRADVAPAGPVTTSFRTHHSTLDGFRLQDIASSGRRSRLRSDGATVPSWNDSLFMIDPAPSFYTILMRRQPVHLQDTPTQTAHVAMVDLERGIKSAWAPDEQIRFPGNISFQDHWENPGLVTIRRGREIGVTSLLNDQPLQPLWLQPLDEHLSNHVIAMSSRQLLICSNSGIRSLHPLTGTMQWTHDWNHSRQMQPLAGQYLKAYCTEQYVILLPSLGTGYVVLRADDGMLLRQGARPSGKMSKLIDGYLLTSTSEQQLNISHLPDGRNVPVDLQDQRVVSFHPIGELGRRRAMIMTDTPELLIIDVSTGHIDSRIPISEGLQDVRKPSLIPKVIRRSGLLYISLGTRTWRPPYIPESVFGEPVAGHGILLCVDPASGDLLWQQDQIPAVMPPIQGDPCPFVLQWTTKYNNEAPQLRLSRRYQRTMLEIHVLDALSGKPVGTTSLPMAARPLQVTHDAGRQQLKITTDHATIVMDYEERR